MRWVTWVGICTFLAFAGCRDADSPNRVEPAGAELSGAQKSRAQDLREAREDLKAVLTRHEPSDVGSFPLFTEVTANSGLEFSFHTDAIPGRYFLPEIMGGGAAWFDFDRDGWLDLFLVNGDELAAGTLGPKRHADVLFHNRGGQGFEEISGAASAGTTGYGQGCAVGDFDGDGFEGIGDAMRLVAHALEKF